MENISTLSAANLSWENPFSASGAAEQQLDFTQNEQFIGNELKAFFDKEEKMYQSTASVKSDEDKSTLPSGITIRSFMIDSEDSDLLHQKLTMSQYIAFKSEPLGKLGDSGASMERPYFSFRVEEKATPDKESVNGESAIAEFNPDFSEEPSWMKKQSLSPLSSSENLELSSKGPENSENWLVVKEPPKMQELRDSLEDYEIPKSLIPEVIVESESPVDSEVGRSVMLHDNNRETSDIPSMYWKALPDVTKGNESKLESTNRSRLELETDDVKLSASRCHSYVAGHVDLYSFHQNGRHQLSDIPSSSSQSSSSVASTVRENTSDFPRYDSIISEPQLSSTREITDDCLELAVSGVSKRMDPLPEMRKSVSLDRTPIVERQDTLPAMEKPKAPIPVGPAHSTQIEDPANDLQNVVDHLDKEWVRMAGTEKGNRTGLSVESLIAVFSNTSSLSTPHLMSKIKDHVMRMKGGVTSSVLPSESSGIGGSGFDSISSDDGSSRLERDLQLSDEQFSRQSIENHRDSIRPMGPPPSVAPMTSSVPDAVPKSPVAKKDRHTLASVPTHSTPGRPARVVCGVRAKTKAVAEAQAEEFARVTATVVKKIPPPATAHSREQPKAKVNIMEQRATPPSGAAPVVKCNKSGVYFGGADFKVRGTQKQEIVLRNSSFKQSLELELRIKDSEDFKVVDGSEAVSRCLMHFEPRQERTVELLFQPRQLGHFNNKLNLYPRSDAGSKKMKYTVDLSGYGGASRVRAMVAGSSSDEEEKVLVPKANGQFWSCQFALENKGNVPAYSYILATDEDGTPMDPNRCIILPQCCTLSVGDVKEINVLIHPQALTGAKKPTPFKLNLFWGDEPLRHRWMKCVVRGVALKQPPQMRGVDWTKLLQVDSSSPIKCPVTEEDMEIFYRNVHVDELSVVFHEKEDSHFVTLAMETATVLEPSAIPGPSDTVLSHRRMTTATTGGRMYEDGCISAGATELIFPSTRVGTVSTEKIPLQNWSWASQEIRVKQITGPFSMRHLRSAVPGGYYTRLPIHFQPTRSGCHTGQVVLEVATGNGHPGQSLNVALKGEAF